MKSRLAKDVLVTVYQNMAKTDLWQQALRDASIVSVEDECRRIVAGTTFPDDGFPQHRFNIDFPYGTVSSRSWEQPPPESAWHWVHVRRGQPLLGSKWWWRFLFVERTTYLDGFTFTIAMYPNGEGRLWLGAQNNSAAIDLHGEEAWAAWVCREQTWSE